MVGVTEFADVLSYFRLGIFKSTERILYFLNQILTKKPINIPLFIDLFYLSWRENITHTHTHTDFPRVILFYWG